MRIVCDSCNSVYIESCGGIFEPSLGYITKPDKYYLCGKCTALLQKLIESGLEEKK